MFSGRLTILLAASLCLPWIAWQRAPAHAQPNGVGALPDPDAMGNPDGAQAAFLIAADDQEHRAASGNAKPSPSANPYFFESAARSISRAAPHGFLAEDGSIPMLSLAEQPEAAVTVSRAAAGETEGAGSHAPHAAGPAESAQGLLETTYWATDLGVSEPAFATLLHPSEALPISGRESGQVGWPDARPMTVPGAASTPAELADGLGNPLGRQRVIFRPAVPTVDNQGRAGLRPDVVVASGQAFAQVMPPPEPPAFEGPYEEYLPPPSSLFFGPTTGPAPLDHAAPGHAGCPDGTCHHDPMGFDEPWVFDGPVIRTCGLLLACLKGPPCYEGMLGAEHVMHAPMFIDTTEPLQNCRVRWDFVYDRHFPDRAEYFWARTALGGIGPMPVVVEIVDGEPVPTRVPRGEPFVDYHDLRFYIERGTRQFSVATDIPIRRVDPFLLDSTAGLGDMEVTTKTVLLDGRRWQLTQVFRSYFPTGSARKGLGTGHVSLEPGVAWRYKWSNLTYLHGDLKFWFPLGGHPDHSGEVLNYGIGISRVLHETDYFAIIPTLELVGWTVLTGEQTPPSTVPANTAQGIDDLTIINLHPGMRFVWENGSDCSTRELGIGSGFVLTNEQWYTNILRIDLRWSF